MKVIVVLILLNCSFSFAQDLDAPVSGKILKPKGKESPKQAIIRPRVFFKNLKDGDVVASPVTVEMGIEGMKVQAAGELIVGTGHHHIIIDKGPMEKGTVIPADPEKKTYAHFGKGETTATLTLTPGKHKLTLQFADGAHMSYGPELSDTITITVKK